MIWKNMERYDVEEYGKIYDMVVCDGSSRGQMLSLFPPPPCECDDKIWQGMVVSI